MLWLCLKLLSCLFGNTRDTSVVHEKATCVCSIYMQPQKSENQICSNKHETGLVHLLFILISHKSLTLSEYYNTVLHWKLADTVILINFLSKI